LGNDELTKSSNGALTDVRFYPSAVRTVAGLTWTTGDQHGTGELAINSSTLALTHRRLDPFGNPRATATWPTDKGFLNDTIDPTGTAHIGVREYDSTTGQFTSADPLLTSSVPQSLNGYSYSLNNPETYEDASGLSPGPGEDDIPISSVADDLSRFDRG